METWTSLCIIDYGMTGLYRIGASRGRTMAEDNKQRSCRLVRVVSCLLAILLASPDDLLAGSAQLPLTAYDQGNGLETLSVTRIVQDRKGQVWAGTENGLYLYDGVGFVGVDQAQGFATSEVVAMAAADGGGLWVASRSGLYLGQDGQFAHVDDGTGRTVLVDRGQTLASMPDGELAAVSDHRLMRLLPGPQGRWRLEPLLPAHAAAVPGDEQVYSVFHHGDTLWFGCGQSICALRQGHVIRYGQAANVPADKWLNFLQARDGTLWARGTRTLRALPPGAQRFIDRSLPADDGDVAASALEMAEDADGGVLTRSAHGVARWKRGSWEFFDENAGIPQIGISTLASDQDGSIWMGTFGRGVLHWGGYGQVQNWTPRQGLSSPLTWSITADDAGDIWVANELGGNVIAGRGERVMPWPAEAAAPHQSRSVLRAADGSMWIVLFDGRVLRYRSDTRRTDVVATVPYFLRGGYLDRSGQLWVLSVGGLYRIQDTGAAVREAPEVIATGMCSDLAEDPAGTLWLACSSGLYRRQQGHWRKLQEGPVASPSGYEHVVATADGGLLLSTLEPGLLRGRLHGDGVTLSRVEDPLLDRTRFYFLRPDRAGRIWAGGGNGVDVLENGRWTRLSMSDGLVWNETDHNAFHADDDGTIWIGTAAGVSHLLDPGALLSPRTLSPRLLSVNHGATRLAPAPSLKLSANSDALEFRLAVLGNSAGYPVHFRYRMQGVDKDWTQTQLRELRYASLPAGSYRLEVQLVDDNRRTVSAPLTLQIELTAPWWRTPWAYAAYLLLGLAGLAVLWRWRNHQLIRHAQVLEHVVQQRTAELQDEKRELEKTQAELYLQATHDQLTGVLNRSAIMESVRLQAQDKDSPQGLALAMLDVDHFKSINDRYGHVAGDVLLRELAQRLLARLPAGAVFGRYGGEEFLLAVRGASLDQVHSVLHDLLEAVTGEPHSWEGHALQITCSVGISWLPAGDTASVNELIVRADELLYQAKRQGRNRIIPEVPRDRLTPAEPSP